MNRTLDLHQLERPYAGLRTRDDGRQARLVGAISRDGLQQAVLVVARGERFVLIDGYRRVAALETLGQDTVAAVVLGTTEAEALAYAHRLDANRRRSALEDGWLLRELIEGFGLRQAQLVQKLQRSASWVSRRLALVRDLPPAVQDAVRDGHLGAHAAEKFFVPLARANKCHAETLANNLAALRPTDRQVERLYTAWRAADAETRRRIVEHPALFLRVDEAPEPPPEGPAAAVVKALEGVTGASGRARKVARESGLHRLDAAERAAVERSLDEATLAFTGLRRVFAEEGLDARQRDAGRGPAAGEERPQRPGDRPGPPDLARIGQ
jgi:ParB/RepB/Spo0J family partition protein